MLQSLLISWSLLAATCAAQKWTNATTPAAERWQPSVGAKFQIVLGTVVVEVDNSTALVPSDAEIFDVDLFHTPADVIEKLHGAGKKVICYFSAGGSENWRPDDSLFKEADRGDPMAEWKGERWLNIRSPDVWTVIQARIEMAYTKGCDGIDPDNLDAFNHESGRGGGFIPKLTAEDTITYLKKLSDEARHFNMSTGLKNAEELLPRVQDLVEFAVNEECASMLDSDGCTPYLPFLAAGKPVFHIEYARYALSNGNVTLRNENTQMRAMSSEQLRSVFCLETSYGRLQPVPAETGSKFSTVIKLLELDGFVLYCDGSWAVTVTRPLPNEAGPLEDEPGTSIIGQLIGGSSGRLGTSSLLQAAGNLLGGSSLLGRLSGLLQPTAAQGQTGGGSLLSGTSTLGIGGLNPFGLGRAGIFGGSSLLGSLSNLLGGSRASASSGTSRASGLLGLVGSWFGTSAPSAMPSQTLTQPVSVEGFDENPADSEPSINDQSDPSATAPSSEEAQSAPEHPRGRLNPQGGSSNTTRPSQGAGESPRPAASGILSGIFGGGPKLTRRGPIQYLW